MDVTIRTKQSRGLGCLVKDLQFTDGRLTPPLLTKKGEDVLVLTWDSVHGCTFRLQFHRDNEFEWIDAARGLTESKFEMHAVAGESYVFRVKPELDNFTWSLGSEPYSLMSTQVTYFLRDSRLEKLPTHILHIVAEFAMDLKWRKSSKRVGSGDYESSERLVLQPSAGAFALICKTCRAAYSHLIWRSHPNSVTVYAWENKCRLLFKSKKIESVKVLVRYDSVSEDVNKFQTLLLGSSPSMAECCPSIKNFEFSVTLTGIDEGHLLSLKEKIGKDFRYFNASSGLDWEISYHMDMLKKAKTIDDISIFYFVHPIVSWSLAALGTTVQGFKLSLSQLPIPDLMRGVDELAVHQVMDIRVANGKALRSSTIKSFHTDLYGLEGCAISNNFNHACYALLPATLEKFSLGGGGNFEIPFAFPPTLQELSLSGVPFSSNKLGLPKNSNIKVVKLSLGFSGAEDSPDFKFKSFDVSDLPDSIEVFEIEGDFPLSGKFSTSSRLKSLVIRSREDGKIDFDALPPTLEELHLAVNDVWGKPATATTAGSLSRSRFPVLRAIKSESQDILNLLKSKAKEMIGLHFVKLENER